MEYIYIFWFFVSIQFNFYAATDLNVILESVAYKKKQFDLYKPLPRSFLENVRNTLILSEKPFKSTCEFESYMAALKYIDKLSKKKRSEITLKDILKIHQIVFTSSNNGHNAGKFRTYSTFIIGSKKILPNPRDIPFLMNDLVSWLNTSTENPIVIAAQVACAFIDIHPFIDGNGRTSRLLTNLILMQEGYPYVPVTMQDRKTYIKTIDQGWFIHDYTEFYCFIAQTVGDSLDYCLARMKHT
jgi:Fic family protein